MDNLHIVRLNVDKLPTDQTSRAASGKIIEALFHFCGLDHMYVTQHSEILYFFRDIPQDIPQAGIHWMAASEEECREVRSDG